MRRRASTSWTVAGSLWLWAATGCNQPVPAEEHVVRPATPSAAAAPEPAKGVDPAALPKGVDVPGSGGAEAPKEPEEPEVAKVGPSAAPVEPAKAPSEAKAKSEKEKPKAEPSSPAPKPEPPAKSEPAAKPSKPAKPGPAKPEPAKPEPAKPEPVKPEPVKPEPVKPEPAPEPAAKPGVKVPRTAHVRVEIPKGMQALLDADTRMQPWADKAMAIVERCYVSKGFGASATLVGVVTMHPNERPDVDVTSLPPTLAAVVACATGDLMRNRMPLFTGPEGQRHTLKVRFTP